MATNSNGTLMVLMYELRKGERKRRIKKERERMRLGITRES